MAQGARAGLPTQRRNARPRRSWPANVSDGPQPSAPFETRNSVPARRNSKRRERPVTPPRQIERSMRRSGISRRRKRRSKKPRRRPKKQPAAATLRNDNWNRPGTHCGKPVLAPESHSHFDVGPFQVDALTVQKRSKIMRTPERLLPPFRAANLLLCSKYVITFRRFCAAFYA